MSRRIFRDVEEALSREVRRITFFDTRTVDRVVLKDTFDPFTGDIVQMPVEATYYDSGADAQNIQYPHFFVKLLKTKEDRTSGRVVPEYGNWILEPIKTSPSAFNIIARSSDGAIQAVGNNFLTTLFQIGKVQPGQALRILNGNNIGTYLINSVTIADSGYHTINVRNTLTLPLPAESFDSTSRTLTFLSPVDLNTIKPGDQFNDSTSAAFSIVSINTNNSSLVLGGSGTPSLLTGGTISRIGNVFQSTDTMLLNFLILDPTQPVAVSTAEGDVDSNENLSGFSPEIPLDVYYLIRIDSKERKTHIDILNRMWEEFNPPRTGLPIIRRTALSADQLLQADIPSGGSSTITVEDNSAFNINDSIFIFDDFNPTQNPEGPTFSRPFESKVISKVSTNQLVLADVVPFNTWLMANHTRVVSNAIFYLCMFHFVDHNTKDVEGAQYWVHEFVFWVQVFMDRHGDPETTSAVTSVRTPVGTLDNNTIVIDDP